MEIPEYYNPVARDIALALVDGFNRHYRRFQATSRQAKRLFELADWQGVQQLVRERIQYYDERVSETVVRLNTELHAALLDDEIWQQAKLYFIGLLTNHKQPELAETFFNSVFTRILHRDYFNNDFIFIRPAISTEYIESDPPSYRSYYPGSSSLRSVLRRIVADFGWQRPFASLARDLANVVRAVHEHFAARWPQAEASYQIQVLSSAFYRNKSAYIFGKVINGSQIYPFAVPVLQDEQGRLYLDTVLLEPWRIGVLFSFSRAYFLVDMDVPSAYVQF
ncbi:MAG: bifunctional isocitrate dehydrogenase kinase/phosphatase, partial [Vogesella sp.]|nr:bifunctional isocitrate dehydrogenase kinase/phosphatase [Vogesella sp.]